MSGPKRKTTPQKIPAQAIEPYIEIVIDGKGHICLQTLGCAGRQCDLLAGQLESSLGEVIERTNKDGYDLAP